MNEVDEQRRDFFVSYTAADRAWAEWIAQTLEAAGYSVVIQAWDFLSGGNFVLDMDEALRQSERTIAVLSTAYFESSFAQAEWAATFATDPASDMGRLIPVRIEDFAPGGLFNSITYVDMVGLEEDEAKGKLVSEIEARIGGRREPASTVTFPGDTPGWTAFPPTLPSLWNLPTHLRNFSGRRRLIERIEDSLDGERVCVLHGLGGVGKSRTAIEYAYLHRSEADIIWRVRAREESAARSDLAELAEALGLVGPDVRQDDAVKAAMAWLATNNSWVLIIDDVVSPERASELIPAGDRGKVLITSQSATGWSVISSMVEVDVLDVDEAREFFAERTRGSGTEVDRLAEVLGRLPLALEQAASYMEATGIDISGYCNRLREHAPTLFEANHPLDYDETVASTWRVAMAEMSAHGDAGWVLELCSLVAPDWFPRGVFDGGDPRFLSNSIISDVRLDSAIAEMRRFSLVSLDADRISVHRLVQWAVRNALDRGELRERVAEMKVILLGAWPVQGGRHPTEWPACVALAPHLEAFARLRLEVDSEDAISAAYGLYLVAVYLRSRGDLHSAELLFEESLTLVEPFDQGAEEVLFDLLNEYGFLLTQLGKHEDGIRCQERCLQMIDELGLAGTDQAAGAMSIAGASFCEAGDDARASRLHSEALEIFRAQSPPDNHKIGSTLGNLGNMRRREGDLAGALKLQREALELLEAEHGPTDIEVAITLSGIARVQRDAGEMAGAAESMNRALEIFEDTAGPESMEVARSCHDLVGVMAELGNFSMARQHVERALNIYREALGAADPRLLGPLDALARLCHELRDPLGQAQAESQMRRIITDAEEEGHN